MGGWGRLSRAGEAPAKKRVKMESQRFRGTVMFRITGAAEAIVGVVDVTAARSQV